MGPQDSDFDWITAREECSLFSEFTMLENNAKESTKIRNGLSGGRPEFVFSNRLINHSFSVIRPRRYETEEQTVVFHLENDHILVQSNNTEPQAGEPLKLTLTLNDDGECRYRVNGKGEFRRWHVLMRSLEHIFF